MERGRYIVSKSIDFSYHIRAQESIAQGALTNSKRADCFVKGIYPTHFSHGYEATLTDVQNNRYIDFICGLGTNLIGYANVQITRAISEQAQKGATFSFSSVTEIKTAEKLKELFPFVTKMRFLKTGTEACMASLKIARAKTGRLKILSDGYHGWADEFISLMDPALGVPKSLYMKKMTSLNDIDDQTAAVILEPVLTDASKERGEYLRELKKICQKNGALLIFDEIITGFRFPKYSVASYFDVIPDIICLGKAMGNGMPISAVAGSDAIMNCGEYFVSSTFAGETLSLASAHKLMCLIQDKYDLNYLWEKGQEFKDKFNSFYPEKLIIEGYPTRGVFKGDDLTKALFWQESCLAGILFGSSFFFNFCHIDLMDSVLSTCRDILTRIKNGAVELKGDMPKSPFAQQMREKK